MLDGDSDVVDADDWPAEGPPLRGRPQPLFLSYQTKRMPKTIDGNRAEDPRHRQVTTLKSFWLGELERRLYGS